MKVDPSKVNVGKTDRLLRAAAGFVILLIALRIESWGLGLVSLALFASAYLRYCPGYALIEISSNKDTPADD